jgi:hypothetical protein
MTIVVRIDGENGETTAKFVDEWGVNDIFLCYFTAGQSG